MRAIKLVFLAAAVLFASPALGDLVGLYDFQDGTANNGLTGPAALPNLNASGVVIYAGAAEFDNRRDRLVLPVVLGASPFTVYVDGTLNAHPQGHTQFVVSQHSSANNHSTDADFVIRDVLGRYSQATFYNAEGSGRSMTGTKFSRFNGKRVRVAIVFDGHRVGFFHNYNMWSGAVPGTLPDLDGSEVSFGDRSLRDGIGFTGVLHEIRIFDHALTYHELRQLRSITEPDTPEFPAGVVSFADKVIDYNPNYGGGPAPDVTQQDAKQILGVPKAGSMSLGNGGQITVRFLDNKLTGSGDSKPDLFIFEADDPETTLIEVRKNKGPWYPVGSATGFAAGIDLDAYGFGRGDWFSAVRITDDGDSPDESFSPGADLVAVGARSTFRWYSEEAWLTYWIQVHVGGRSTLRIRDNTLHWIHEKGTAPGLARAFHSLGADSSSPTIIDSNQGPNIAWVPDSWREPLGNGTHPWSYAYFSSLTPVFPQREWCWTLKKRLGSGYAAIVEQPSERNYYTLVIHFNDLGRGNNAHLSGSDFYSIELKTTGRGC